MNAPVDAPVTVPAAGAAERQRVLLTGAGGQLGRALVATAPATIELVACTRSQLDITDLAEVKARLATLRPHAVINAAAYTAVDQAEAEPARAEAINVGGADHLARHCAAHGARLVHLSTDFVFDGAVSRPYAPQAPVAPLGVYGRTKAAGEAAVLASAPTAVVLRTAWLYGPSGRNFLTTMLRLMAQGTALRVVADQVGAPTAVDGLAHAIWRLLAQPEVCGIQHWTDAGCASWYDFATAIAEEATAAGRFATEPVVLPIGSVQYPTPAARPAYSVLDCGATRQALALPAEHWRKGLRRVLGDLPASD